MFKKLLIGLYLLLPCAVANAAPVLATVVLFGFTIGEILYVAMFAVSAYMSIKAKNAATGSQTQSQQKQTLKVSRPPKQVIYGKGLFAGSLIFAEEQTDDKKNSDGTYSEWLYTAHGMCNHEVEEVVSVFFDEKPLSDFLSDPLLAQAVVEAQKAFDDFDGVYNSYEYLYLRDKLDSAIKAAGNDFCAYAPHNNSTVADQYLLDNAPSWKSDMIGKNTLWLRVAFLFDREKYASGMPTVTAIVKGKKLYDPRNGVTSYSNNAALVIYDYFVNHMNISTDRMIVSGFGSFIDAANLCDELVEGLPRYTINGRFNLSEKPTDILGSLLQSCGGELVRVGGKIGLLPSAYYGGVTRLTIGSSDIIGDINIKPEPSYKDAVNTVKGTFVDPDQDYVEADYPTVIEESALARVGGEISTDMKFVFVTNPDQAQRLASIQLKRTLAGGGIELQTNLKGLYARTGMVIDLDVPELGLIGEYRVNKSSNHISEGVTLTLTNDGIQIYDDAIGIPFISPPLTSLPISGVREPSNITFAVDKVGDIIQGKLIWSINHPQSASTDIRIKEYLTGEVVFNANVTGATLPINGLVAGNYIFEVRTVSTSGATSVWVSKSFLIDVPNAPTSIDIDQSNWNIRLTPNVEGGVPDGTIFEFKYLADSESYLTGNPTYSSGSINNALTKSVFSGSSFNHGGLTPDRYQHYWVRAINSYGASDWVYAMTWTLNDQDLITTVVQRLESIEIVSSNYLQGVNGYKINVDGSVEFNNASFRGDIRAESLTFVTTSAIPSNINNAYSDPKGSASAAQANAINASDPVGSAASARYYAEQYALAKANLAEITAKAHADGIVTTEEARAIADATAKANTAQASAIAASDPRGSAAAVNNTLTTVRDSVYPIDNLSSGVLQLSSDNYNGTETSAGTNGWAIGNNGNAVFNNAIVRGTVYAYDGIFSGNVAAASFNGIRLKIGTFKSATDDDQTIYITSSERTIYHYSGGALMLRIREDTLAFDMLIGVSVSHIGPSTATRDMNYPHIESADSFIFNRDNEFDGVEYFSFIAWGF